MKLFPHFFGKYIYISALEMASPANQHCANCIGALSFPIEFTAPGCFACPANLEVADLLARVFGETLRRQNLDSSHRGAFHKVVVRLSTHRFHLSI